MASQPVIPRLPNELIVLVALELRRLDDTPTLAALILVSKTLQHALAPILYQHITITSSQRLQRLCNAIGHGPHSTSSSLLTKTLTLGYIPRFKENAIDRLAVAPPPLLFPNVTNLLITKSAFRSLDDSRPYHTMPSDVRLLFTRVASPRKICMTMPRGPDIRADCGPQYWFREEVFRICRPSLPNVHWHVDPTWDHWLDIPACLPLTIHAAKAPQVWPAYNIAGEYQWSAGFGGGGDGSASHCRSRFLRRIWRGVAHDGGREREEGYQGRSIRGVGSGQV